MKVRKEKEVKSLNRDLVDNEELSPADRYLNNQIVDRRAALESQGQSNHESQLVGDGIHEAENAKIPTPLGSQRGQFAMQESPDVQALHGNTSANYEMKESIRIFQNND